MSWKTRPLRQDFADGGFPNRDGGPATDGVSWPGSAPAAQAETAACDAADTLLQKTRRSSLVTLEAAVTKARPHRPGRRRFRADAAEAAEDLMTLSRLALKSADRLNGVAGALVGCARGDAQGPLGMGH